MNSNVKKWGAINKVSMFKLYVKCGKLVTLHITDFIQQLVITYIKLSEIVSLLKRLRALAICYSRSTCTWHLFLKRVRCNMERMFTC